MREGACACGATKGLEWDGIFVKRNWDKNIMKIPLRKKKNRNERGSVYMWDKK